MENNEVFGVVSEIIKLGIGIFFFVFAWIFLRRLTKALTGMARIEENHEELMEKLQEMESKLDELSNKMTK